MLVLSRLRYHQKHFQSLYQFWSLFCALQNPVTCKKLFTRDTNDVKHKCTMKNRTDQKKNSHRKKCIKLRLFNDEHYHQKLKYICNFDKKHKLKTNFLSIKLYIRLSYTESHFQHGFLHDIVLFTKNLFSIFVFCQNCNYV